MRLYRQFVAAARNSACQTLASCTGAAAAVLTTIAYSHSNRLPLSVSKRAGDNSLIATSAMAYDDIGNLIAVNGPAVRSRGHGAYHYNVQRELVGTVSPEQDGAGGAPGRSG